MQLPENVGWIKAHASVLHPVDDAGEVISHRVPGVGSGIKGDDGCRGGDEDNGGKQ